MSSSSSSILFATIGDFTNYQVVEYSIQGKKERSKVSFLALKKFLNISKAVAILGISTAERLECKCEDYKSCSECIVSRAREYEIIADEYIIAPIIFKNFKSKPEYFYSYVYYKALGILEREKPEEIYLDTTHGVNYMPVLAKDALLLATSAYAARHEKKVGLKIYNSDPVARGFEGPYELHSIESIEITPLSGLKYVTSQILNKDKNFFQSLVREKALRNVDEIYKIASALDNGLFIYLAEKSKGILVKIFDSEDVKVEVIESEKGEKIIKSEYKGMSHALVHALLYVALRFKIEGECLDIDTLRELAEKYADVVTSTIIKNEINIIEKEKGRIGVERKLLREIFGGQEGGFDKRIIYAHGGLPRAGTYIYKFGEKICVSYGDKIGEIENYV